MKPSSVVSSSMALAMLALAPDGQAQQRGSGAREPTPEVLPPSPAGGNGPAVETVPEEKKAPGSQVAGYGYNDKPSAASKSASHTRYRANGPVVNMPGFEQTSDGGSRLFVQLSQSVQVEERKAQGSLTYVLKGASPRVWNNTNALVTVHFNTPVSRARLVPQGRDLLFIVDLRAGATPTWKVNEAENKTATLAIDFPKGDYLALGAGEAAGGADPAAARPAPKTGAGAGRGGKRRGTKAPAAPRNEAPPADGPKP